ncbi:amino acid adenylation domain-containing protein [Streptomyces spinoverrucosus]|uniref:amino acid adenylation domain-containing protein n=1 Tax=Streptomyces spinoverrucosus TaxID=284043 RepID=UPI0018C435D7|nr:amino acid adenylation domain-containing protein [Streptomyces spinoverrucosus]MBG0855812.1 amino acid adenylation domain-containing protein [Streptomyces spinoverrucosus]
MSVAVDGREAAKRYWQDAFTGLATRERAFPAARRADGAQDAGAPVAYAEYSLTLDPRQAARLTAAAERWGVAFDTLADGVWAVALALRSGRDDVVFGHVDAGGEAVPLRVRLPAGRPVSAWLRELSAQLRQARRHLGVAPEDIRRWAVGGDGELFDSIVSSEPADGPATPVALRVRGGAAPRFVVDAVTEALSATAAAELLDVLDRATQRLAADPEPLLGDLIAAASGVLPLAATGGVRPGAGADALMSADTREALLATVCRADDEGDTFVPVQEMFAAAVRQWPDAIAVEAPDGELTFADLDVRARRLAARLRSRGAGAETVVAVLTERTGELVAAVLGIWAAGAAFLLVDPGEPERRTRHKLAQAGVRLVVADAAHQEAAARLGPPVVAVTDDTEPGEVPAYARPLPRQLAYAVFTSGSTGNPKGVLIDHLGLAEHVHTQLAPVYRRVSPDGSGLRVGGAAPVTFDSFIDQMLPMITLGHRLVLFDEMQRRDPGSFLTRAPGTELDVVDCAPSQLVLLVEFGLLQTPLKLLVFGGEKPGAQLWDTLRQARAHAVSVYGATECSIGSVEADVHRDPRVCLGRPAGSGTVYVLSPEQKLLPPGLVGEIYLGGPGVGRGYAGDPAHTARAFLPDPFSNRPGARMYRTGDLGRVAPDGRLVFLGRVDDQLKISGYRIEPAEIEAALDAVTGVRRSAVLPVRSASADRLVGFVECAEDFDAERAMAELAARLPSYMVPKRLIPVDTLPLTPNGKVDRKQLARGVEPHE